VIIEDLVEGVLIEKPAGYCSLRLRLLGWKGKEVYVIVLFAWLRGDRI